MKPSEGGQSGKTWEKSNGMRTFREYLGKVKPEVDARIGEIVEGSVYDPDTVRMLLRGKRLRSGLMLLTFDSFRGNRDRRGEALDLACALELAHSSSLMLDDMLDEDGERRGLPTIHLTKGYKRAMLEIIGLLSLPYGIASKHGGSFVGQLSETHRRMVNGVVGELSEETGLPAEAYDAIVTNKTGRLFGLAAVWGCSLSLGRDPGDPSLIGSLTGDLQAYGLQCGKILQIADDILDLQRITEGRKASGFGSEILLLKCVYPPRIVDGLFSKEGGGIDPIKTGELLSRGRAKEGLQKMLRRAVSKASSKVSGIDFPDSEYWGIVRSAPGEIAEMMLPGGLDRPLLFGRKI